MTCVLIAYTTVEGHTATIADAMREALEAGAPAPAAARP